MRWTPCDVVNSCGDRRPWLRHSDYTSSRLHILGVYRQTAKLDRLAAAADDDDLEANNKAYHRDDMRKRASGDRTRLLRFISPGFGDTAEFSLGEPCLLATGRTSSSEESKCLLSRLLD